MSPRLATRSTVLVTLAGLTAAVLTAGSRTASAAVSAPRPTIGTVSPASGPAKGGTRVRITGTNFTHVQKVTFGGVPSTHRTVAASHKSMTVTAPPNELGWATVIVTTAAGRATRALGFDYLAPTTIDPPRDAPLRITCPGGHCYGMDQYGNFVEATSGGLWTDHGSPSTGVSAATTKVLCIEGRVCPTASCPRIGWCMTVDDQGQPLLWSSGRWHRYPALPPAIKNSFRWNSRYVSCGSVNFCVIMDKYADYSFWNGKSWSAFRTLTGKKIVDGTDMPTAGGAQYHVGELSCAGNACMMFDGSMSARKFTHGHWSKPVSIPYASDPYENDEGEYLSCANVATTDTRLLCVMAIDDSNGTYVTVYKNGAWQKSDTWKLYGPFFEAASCSHPGRCLLVENDGTTFEYGDSATRTSTHGWSGPYAMPSIGTGRVQSTSCQNSTTCTAVTSNDLATTYRVASHTWSTPSRIVVDRLGLSAVGCALHQGARFCLAGDVGPYVVDYVGGRWRQHAAQLDIGDRTVSVSCVTGTQFCIALSARGKAVADSAGSLAVSYLPDDTYVSVACWSTTGCYALSAKNLYQWDGTSWTGPTDLASRGITAIADIACAAGTSSCLAVTKDAHSFRVDGTTTTAPVAMPVSHPDWYVVDADACRDADHCVALFGTQLYSYTEAAGWTDVGPKDLPFPDVGVPVDISCAPSSATTHCVAVGYQDFALSWDGTTVRYIGNPNRRYREIVTTGVSCPSTTACYAGDDMGELRVYP
jgi:hypothetical protein